MVEVDYAKHSVFVYRPETEAPEVIRDRIAWPFAADLSDIFGRIV